MITQAPLSLDSIRKLTEDLCRFSCMVVSDENEKLHRRLSEELPFLLHEFPSGMEVNGWQIPKKWSVLRALIRKNGDVVFDGQSNPLGVAFYSRPFSGKVSLEELKKHVSTTADLPEAYIFHCMWQYRPWEADWAFSIPYELFSTFTEGEYEIQLVTEYADGKMLCAEFTKVGKSEKTIVFNSHTCHPNMANDGFSGVATGVRLFQWLQTQDTFYTYKLCLWPEHLGTVFYLDRFGESELPNFVSAIFYEMGGVDAPLKAASTFRGGQMLDIALRHALRQAGASFELVPWRQGAGNDETVWEAPGYEVPCLELTRCKSLWSPYREYHTNLDTPESLDWDKIEEAYQVLMNCIFILEENISLHRKFDGLICLSNPKYNLYFERPDPSVAKGFGDDAEQWGYLSDCMFRYFDGSMSLLDIAEKHQLSFVKLLAYFQKFQEKELLETRRVEIPYVERSSRIQTRGAILK